ncbi:putative benzoate 4-monooxygenase cytochrome P450 [Geopyxis carbonaria]|nr:putative benzoate 4-monooxygenase cytochrome P450 [Geopyxis carbonaria]
MLTLLLTVVILAITFLVYHHLTHPLRSIPGPLTHVLSPLPSALRLVSGGFATHLKALHRRHGPIVRLSPNQVSFTSPSALAPIYTQHGGFPKSSHYTIFDFGPHATLFSTLSLPARAARARAVAPLFASSALRRAEPGIARCVTALILRLRARAGQRINLYEFARAYALDAMSMSLFGRCYGAQNENEGLSAAGFIDAFGEQGAAFYLPAWIMSSYLSVAPTPANRSASIERVEAFTQELVDNAESAPGSFQHRLCTQTDLTKKQVQAECMDLIFAGSDSTGLTLAWILWYLIRHPAVLAELASERTVDSPLLQAVLKETLRLADITPLPLPRVVPEGGWSFDGHYFPPGTVVGVAGFELHRDEAVFGPDLLAWRPHRWLHGSNKTEMARSWFAFGKGPRGCIAQNLAMLELSMAVLGVVKLKELEGAATVLTGEEGIALREWFNSSPKSGKIEVVLGRGQSTALP